MDIQSWAIDSYHRIRQDGASGVRASIDPVYHLALSQLTRFVDSGEDIYNHEWDLLIIVDACRFDLMAEVASDASFINEMTAFRSTNTATAEWMRDTFPDQEETSNTAYICGNPFSESELDAAWFADLHEVWRDAWTTPGTVPPRAVTDQTIRAMRGEDHKRVIAHYMQPHCPFIPNPEVSAGKNLEQFGDQDHRDVWELYRDDEISKTELWAGYRANLELVLEDVELLLNSVDAPTTIITSDHGNAMGEWGIYGHPANMPLNTLRRVPWIKLEASNDGEYTPEETSTTTIDRDEQLKSLGYLPD